MSCVSSRSTTAAGGEYKLDARPHLTRREIEVLVAWLRNDSKASAARTLHISASTVGTHVQRIRDKYAAVGRPANSKVALAVRAIQDGLVTAESLCPPAW